MGKNWELIKGLKEEPCSYRPGQMSKVFAITNVAEIRNLSPAAVKTTRQLYETFLPLGYEAGLLSVFGRECPDCNACVPLRIAVKNYPFSLSDRLTMKANADLNVTIRQGRIDSEHFDLLKKYLLDRHPESPMLDSLSNDFFRTLLSLHSHVLEIHDANRNLIAGALVDKMDTGLNGYYLFYDPDESRRSLGTLCYLKLIENAQSRYLDHLYIGHWVEDSDKLGYKKRFKNLETFDGSAWVPFDPLTHREGPHLRKIIPIFPA